MVSRPVIIRNPPDDRAFQDAIEEVLDGGAIEPATAQERLRERYPQAVVRRRELADETIPVWYVYREGRWVPGD